MTGRNRFIKSVIASTNASETQMPWTRGSTRRKMIARRDEAASQTPRIKTG